MGIQTYERHNIYMSMIACNGMALILAEGQP